MPAGLRRRAEAEKQKHGERFAPPGFAVSGEVGAWTFECPYSEADRDNWEALLFAAFGSCSQSVVNVFLGQLSRIVGKGWDPDQKDWLPELDEMNAAIALVASVKPANEMQAALAAQFVALHLTAMGLASGCAGQSYPDERTAATLARVAKSAASIVNTIASLQGVRTTRHETHVHYHTHDEKHVHMEGVRQFGGQPYEARATGELAECKALPCQDQEGDRLPMPRNAERAVSDSWRQKLWRTLRGG